MVYFISTRERYWRRATQKSVTSEILLEGRFFFFYTELLMEDEVLDFSEV